MDWLIDLDAAAREVEVRRAAWVRDGLSVSSLTWRDAEDEWPWKPYTGRSDVQDPDSIGVVLTRAGGDVEAQVVLFGDVVLGSLTGPVDGIVNEAPEIVNLEAFGTLLDDVATRAQALDRR